MSAGSKIIPVRIDPDLLERIAADLGTTNARRFGEPLTLSSWLRQAAAEKLDKRLRSRAKRGV